MKLRLDQLDSHLGKSLSGIYLITGDEPLLAMEAGDRIRAKARQAGFDERQLFHAEAGFDWNQLRDEAEAMSLFASQRLLEVRIPNGKPSDKGETLKSLAKSNNPDNLVLVICPRLDSKSQNTAWFKAIEKDGVVVQIWPIERNQYPGWLKNRLQQAGLQADPAAVSMLAQHTEGNLLAAVQEIEKLRISGVQVVSEEMLVEILGDNSRFDAFGYADACLVGNIRDASRMLSHLKSEGVDSLSVLGALTHKLRQLLLLHGKSGAQLSEAFKQSRIWPRQQNGYKSAISRLSLKQLHEAIKLAERVDSAAKGMGGDPWLLLSELTILVTNTRLNQSSSL